MKQTFIHLSVMLLAALACASCGNNGEALYFAFDNITAVDSFPNTADLTQIDPEIVDIDVAGMQNVSIYDSLLCVMSSNANGYMYVYNKNTMHFYGSFIKQGRGPGEVLWNPGFNHFSRSDDGRLFFSDNMQIIELDLDASVKKGQTVASVYKENQPNNLDYYLVVSDSFKVAKSINPAMDGFTRVVIKDGKSRSTVNQEILNGKVLTKGDPGKFNLLGSAMAYDSKNDVVVEMSIMTNTINLYSLFSDFAMTLCVGEKPDDIHRLEKAIYGSTGDVFRDLKTYEDIFLVLYAKGKGEKTVMAFQWDGRPVASIKVPKYVGGVCADLDNNVLYAVDSENERLLKWNL